MGAVVLLAILCGCSSFNRDWDRVAKAIPPTNSIEGRWEGRWISETNGHNGKLRCLMTRESETNYQARFRASYAGIFRFSYTVPLEVQSHEGGWEFNGEADLGGFAGGTYYYEGRASPTNLWSTYCAERDHGIFKLERPK